MKNALLMVVASLSVFCLETQPARSSDRKFYEIKYVIQLQPNFEISGLINCDKSRQCDVYQNASQDFSLTLIPKSKNHDTERLFLYCKSQPCLFEGGGSYSQLEIGKITDLKVYKGQYSNGMELQTLRKFGEIVISAR